MFSCKYLPGAPTPPWFGLWGLWSSLTVLICRVGGRRILIHKGIQCMCIRILYSVQIALQQILQGVANMIPHSYCTIQRKICIVSLELPKLCDFSRKYRILIQLYMYVSCIVPHGVCGMHTDCFRIGFQNRESSIHYGWLWLIKLKGQWM